MKYIFYSDVGHGWIKVSIKELVQLGIQNKISGYSYMRNNSAYLEEDCDLSIFFKAKNLIVGQYKFEDICRIKNSNYSTIRSYESYDYQKYLSIKTMIEKYDNDEIIRKWINKTLDEKSKCQYFANKTKYSEISHNGRSWFNGIAKTLRQNLEKTCYDWIEYLKALNSDTLKEKIDILEIELKHIQKLESQSVEVEVE